MLRIAKMLGLFWLARRLTRQRLRILCYHGFSLHDEHVFKNKLFMTGRTFGERMQWITDAGYPVLDLAQAIADLNRNSLPDNAVVITVDDGWYGFKTLAAPVLSRLKLPSTLYVTSYYMDNQAPLFNIMMGYLLWTSKLPTIDLNKLHSELEGYFDLRNEARRDEAARRLTLFGAANLSREERNEFIRSVARQLDINFSDLPERFMQLINRDEVRALADDGIDIQLHTHRHTMFPVQKSLIDSEIQVNRERLQSLSESDLAHFCYPNGWHRAGMYPILERLGIKSAVTTAPGLCTKHSNRLALPRIVDGENLSMLDFEAEISGFLDIVRQIKKKLAP